MSEFGRLWEVRTTFEWAVSQEDVTEDPYH